MEELYYEKIQPLFKNINKLTKDQLDKLLYYQNEYDKIKQNQHVKEKPKLKVRVNKK